MNRRLCNGPSDAFSLKKCVKLTRIFEQWVASQEEPTFLGSDSFTARMLIKTIQRLRGELGPHSALDVTKIWRSRIPCHAQDLLRVTPISETIIPRNEETIFTLCHHQTKNCTLSYVFWEMRDAVLMSTVRHGSRKKRTKIQNKYFHLRTEWLTKYFHLRKI